MVIFCSCIVVVLETTRSSACMHKLMSRWACVMSRVYLYGLVGMRKRMPVTQLVRIVSAGAPDRSERWFPVSRKCDFCLQLALGSLDDGYQDSIYVNREKLAENATQ